MPENADDPRKRPSGRRAGESGTRDAILDAASDRFAERGYDGASIRAIAAVAGVDPALIRHFFVDKDGLFAATIKDRTAIPKRLGAALAGDSLGLGSRVADAYFRLWEEPETQTILLALVRSSTTSDRTARMLLEVIAAHIPDDQDLGTVADERIHRVALAASHLLGTAIARYVIKLPPLVALAHDDLVTEIAPTIQRYLTGTHR
ncbi:TetR family transcriptional regulator [Cryobacterium psychrophilum]|uniref:TetR/AcrR family transcriptional regulator n=1 Tax=Cryobacterium psychrophilum TaxID=41988 RepID=A0A4Y8KU78_9MICO|nr:TetR family transcriptional regulator [Cryobacterium psychrophilum]TDW28748.1 TetR family transcriptional regulator [Cryobacterium psychrophilum]TFD82403.1 TetR/AcrR family transcriptional regulator [Cryobacterium psychrophilum]